MRSEACDQRAEKVGLAQLGEAVTADAQVAERRVELPVAELRQTRLGQMLAHEGDTPTQPLELVGIDERLQPARARRLVQRPRDRRLVDARDLRRPGAPLVEHELVVRHALDDFDALGAPRSTRTL